jgi:hypothetical protein
MSPKQPRRRQLRGTNSCTTHAPSTTSCSANPATDTATYSRAQTYSQARTYS